MSKKKILIVEDNVHNMTMMADLLAHSGYDVLPICDGRLALAAYHRFRPDLIIMDLMLNDGLLGIELIQQLREDPGFDTPVVGSTSEVTALADKFYAICDKKMQKPLALKTILATVKDVVG